MSSQKYEESGLQLWFGFANHLVSTILIECFILYKKWASRKKSTHFKTQLPNRTRGQSEQIAQHIQPSIIYGDKQVGLWSSILIQRLGRLIQSLILAVACMIEKLIKSKLELEMSQEYRVSQSHNCRICRTQTEL